MWLEYFRPSYLVGPPSASITAWHLAGILSMSLTRSSGDTESHTSLTILRRLSEVRCFPQPDYDDDGEYNPSSYSDSFNRVKMRWGGWPENRSNELLPYFFRCTCYCVSVSIILHYGDLESYLDHAMVRRNYFPAIFLGLNRPPLFLIK